MNRRNDDLDSWIQRISNENLRYYIEHRVLPQMEFYSNKSQKYKSIYFSCMNASIFISFLIPVVSVFSNGSTLMKAVISALGAALAGITAYLSIHNYKDLWESYRAVREQTYTVLLFYFTSSGVFCGKKPEEQERLVIELCEEIFKSENQVWTEMVGSVAECSNK